MIAQARLAARLTVRDRPLLADYVRWTREGRRAVAPRRRAPDAEALTMPEALALVEAELGPWETGPARMSLSEWFVPPEARVGGGTEQIGGDSALGELAYAVVRASRPDAVVETGVATGVTSAHILAALADNAHGELHSVDLPPTDMLVGGTVGAAIPPDLKERWHYHWGSARRLLGRVLGETRGGRRVFVHDSDHSYDHMTWELRTAWQALAPGDVLICDDVDFHAAFADAAYEFGTDPILVRQAEKAGTTGLLIR